MPLAEGADQALGKAVMKVQDILDALSRSGIVQKMDVIVLAELPGTPGTVI